MYKFAIDRGGTFTDVFAICPTGQIQVMKLLSEDPDHYKDAPLEAIYKILSSQLPDKYTKRCNIDTKHIEWIRMGTTVATNALLERKGEPIALVVTKGFKDILEIGNQSRDDIFELNIKRPQLLYEEVIEVDERVVIKQDVCQINNKTCEVVVGNTGDYLEIWKPINLQVLRQNLEKVFAKGIKSLAVVLLHSYTFPKHEELVEKVAKDIGFTQITLSSHVIPMVKVVPRGLTACADAYLTPHIKDYIKGFSSGFRNGLQDLNVLFMQSDGGLASVNKFSGCRSILSGPAGGVVGFAHTTYDDLGNDLPIIGFDMGGTSTDVSRYSNAFEHTFETKTAGITIQTPQLDIQTVAAGGGSKLYFRDGLFVVGPESAGAYPGPTCYRNNGSLTVTDANLCLGRIIPKYFPKIFGPQKDQPLDIKETNNAFIKLTDNINEFLEKSESYEKKLLTVEEVAIGFVKVANESMCRPIRAITQGKGYDTANHILACFGGAGGQHACAIARSLGMSKVFIHKYSGILSAFGMALADVVHEETIPTSFEYNIKYFDEMDKRIINMINKCNKELKLQDFKDEDIKVEIYLNMRYEKTDFPVMTQTDGLTKDSSQFCSEDNFKNSFLTLYKREFGFTLSNRNILVDDIRVRGIGSYNELKFSQKSSEKSNSMPQLIDETNCYFEYLGHLKTPIYLMNDLKYGHQIDGPAIIIDTNFTVLIEPNCRADITQKGNILIEVKRLKQTFLGTNLDPIQLSIFSHRFMSIAEQMGRVLQRTSISTNIKERLDFSCALFGPNGGLVSNAPHIPVHLGSMGKAVEFQLKHLKDDLHSGDVILTNHPLAGGSHLPDLTVITPVFYSNDKKPIFFVANRGHHADIGGLTPGSMPPHSTSIYEEGAAIISFKLVKDGVFQEKGITDILMSPSKYKGCSGTRNLSNNLSDLRAQVAANQKGISLVTELIDFYGLDVIQAYMRYIQSNADLSVRQMLKQTVETLKTNKLFATDYMDFGSKIELKIEINETTGDAVFDFTGTDEEVYGNCNAPKAVVLSAVIYCLRCLVGHDMPLNQGCLSPIQVIIPDNCILSPAEDAAVVGGNVETSQRITDVILKAFGVCAASQGTMNNITFGDENIGYYETVAGGSGATAISHGTTIHTHMTNTRITDIEIIEKRYPIIVQSFTINRGSGGTGRFNGGNGVIRQLLFRKQLILSVLTERRVFSPFGMNGGNPGKRGKNLLKISKSGRTISLGSKTSVEVNAGDLFHLETPGGGGYGQSCQ
ncbi:5-oxoprolinase-like [Oppia nitens]|uniref:5-oxoprolinase-like n=1 Tax=Oppia nitens TaxID=1686743 RepID=UPI0023DB0769|nr:5-oxoprolinase-like [Oppia nitens]XP_054168712.1 5-oxoprolinase-like [Oppia nitens]